jgi:hypothetical protein
MAAAQQRDVDAYQRLLTELLPFVGGIVRGRTRWHRLWACCC